MQIFISYSRQDETLVRKLAQSLQADNFDIWLDVLNISSGEKWANAIQQGLDDSDAMVLVITPTAMESNQVANEWQYYLEENKPVIPIRLKPAKIHYQLRPLQYIDFHEQDFEVAVQQLIVALSDAVQGTTDPAERIALDILESAYHNWLNFERSADLLLDEPRLKRILDVLKTFEISDGLWRYLLASIVHSKFDIEQAEYLQKSLQNLDSEQQIVIIEPLLLDPVLLVRRGIIGIISALEVDSLQDSLVERIAEEDDDEALLTIIQTLKQLGNSATPAIAAQAFDKSKQWHIRSQLLSMMQHKTKYALFVSDGTELAQDFMSLASKSGFELVEVTPDDLFWLPVLGKNLPDDIFYPYQLVIIMKGEHYSDLNHTHFYTRLIDYVKHGGALFASSWVGWESRDNEALASILPFEYEKFTENVNLTCQPTVNGLSEGLFTKEFTFMTSCETLTARPEAQILLESDTQNPVFGYWYVGEGRSFYLNTCQHSCTKPFDSPMRVSEPFRESFTRVFEWLYSEVSG